MRILSLELYRVNYDRSDEKILSYFNLFRNLCLSLRHGCSARDLLLLWKHECDWIYNRRLVDFVDRERYQQTFVNAVKKQFSSPEQV